MTKEAVQEFHLRIRHKEGTVLLADFFYWLYLVQESPSVINYLGTMGQWEAIITDLVFRLENQDGREGRGDILHTRVQLFWLFFRNSICFMCFWLGLKILRLVYKKAFLKYWMVSILFDLLSTEKSSFAPDKNWKKISSKLAVQGIKRSGISRWFQKCAEVSSLVEGKKCFTEKLNF